MWIFCWSLVFIIFIKDFFFSVIVCDLCEIGKPFGMWIVYGLYVSNVNVSDIWVKMPVLITFVLFGSLSGNDMHVPIRCKSQCTSGRETIEHVNFQLQ